jgi:hypothetical protein
MGSPASNSEDDNGLLIRGSTVTRLLTARGIRVATRSVFPNEINRMNTSRLNRYSLVRTASSSPAP